MDHESARFSCSHLAHCQPCVPILTVFCRGPSCPTLLPPPPFVAATPPSVHTAAPRAASPESRCPRDGVSAGAVLSRYPLVKPHASGWITERKRITERSIGVTLSPLTDHRMVLLSQLPCSSTVLGRYPQTVASKTWLALQHRFGAGSFPAYSQMLGDLEPIARHTNMTGPGETVTPDPTTRTTGGCPGPPKYFVGLR